MDKLKVGDIVVMHSCGEAGFEKNYRKQFKVMSSPWKLGGSNMVRIDYVDSGERAYTSFSVEYLQPIQ